MKKNKYIKKVKVYDTGMADFMVDVIKYLDEVTSECIYEVWLYRKYKSIKILMLGGRMDELDDHGIVLKDYISMELYDHCCRYLDAYGCD